MHAILLIAAADDWIKILPPLIFFLIWALNWALGGKQKPPARPARRAADPERALRPPQPPQPQADNQSQLNAEIEQFLKRANQRRSENPKREAAPAAKTVQSQPKPPKPRPTVREQPKTPPRERAPLTSVSESVEKHIAGRSFQDRTEHLADDIARVDAQMEEHLHKAFDRKVGTLAETPVEAAVVTDAAPQAAMPVAPVAGELARLLAQPENIRQAIILNEILVRPEHRW